MRIKDGIALDFDDILLLPQRSTLTSRSQVNLHKEYTFLHSRQTFKGIPIMASNMTTVGTYNASQVMSKFAMFTCLHKFVDIDLFEREFVDDNFAFTIGLNTIDYIRFKQAKILRPSIRYLCVDVANGYTERFVNFITQIREENPDITIIAGNVVTPEMTQELLLKGADIVKVGIGSSPICKTRIQTGVGFPQLQSVIECADAAHGLGGHIISDGGCKNPGDVVKAFAAGADFVMLGTMLAGHNENSEVDEDGNVVIYGMSSRTANVKYFGGLDTYRTSEGRTVKIPLKGDLSDTLQDVLGGLRSACTYVGAKRLKDLPKCATAVRVNATHSKILESNTIGD